MIMIGATFGKNKNLFYPHWLLSSEVSGRRRKRSKERREMPFEMETKR